MDICEYQSVVKMENLACKKCIGLTKFWVGGFYDTKSEVGSKISRIQHIILDLSTFTAKHAAFDFRKLSIEKVIAKLGYRAILSNMLMIDELNLVVCWKRGKNVKNLIHPK